MTDTPTKSPDFPGGTRTEPSGYWVSFQLSEPFFRSTPGKNRPNSGKVFITPLGIEEQTVGSWATQWGLQGRNYRQMTETLIHGVSR